MERDEDSGELDVASTTGEMGGDAMEPETMKARIQEDLKGKDEVSTAAVDIKKHIGLLDLPVDVLKEIMKEVQGWRTSLIFNLG